MARPLLEHLIGGLGDDPQEKAIGARIDRLERAVEELVSELRSKPTVSSAALVDLGTDDIRLRQPVHIVIEQYEEEVTASWPEVEAFGSGSSAGEAILALKRDIVALYRDLQSTPDEELGALSLAWKRTLGIAVAEEFSNLVRCPMSGSDYEALMRQKIAEGRL